MVANKIPESLVTDVREVDRGAASLLKHLYTCAFNAPKINVHEFNSQVEMFLNARTGLGYINATSMRILVEDLCSFERGFLIGLQPYLEYMAGYLKANKNLLYKYEPLTILIFCLDLEFKITEASRNTIALEV